MAAKGHCLETQPTIVDGRSVVTLNLPAESTKDTGPPHALCNMYACSLKIEYPCSTYVDAPYLKAITMPGKSGAARQRQAFKSARDQ